MEFEPGLKGLLVVLWDVLRHPMPKDPETLSIDWSAVGRTVEPRNIPEARRHEELGALCNVRKDDTS